MKWDFVTSKIQLEDPGFGQFHSGENIVLKARKHKEVNRTLVWKSANGTQNGLCNWPEKGPEAMAELL